MVANVTLTVSPNELQLIVEALGQLHNTYRKIAHQAPDPHFGQLDWGIVDKDPLKGALLTGKLLNQIDLK